MRRCCSVHTVCVDNLLLVSFIASHVTFACRTAVAQTSQKKKEKRKKKKNKKVILQIDQQPSIIDVKHKAGTHIPTEIVYEESSSIERANQTIQGQIRAIKDYNTRQMSAIVGLDSSVLTWLFRHAAWTLTTLHVGSDGMTAHQRIGGKPFNQQIAAFGDQINPFQTTQNRRNTAGIRCELAGRLLARFQHEDG